MIQNTWGHGYFEDCRYTCGFYRETAPNWLDFCALLRGIRPPRELGASFRYLELGSGMGFNLCMLAAAHPEASFVGIDFNADQISHSKNLAEILNLSNIIFVEADFTELSKQEAKLPPSLTPRNFEYVSLHGVLTWVTEPVQNALIHCIERFTKAGGLIYCSYNTNPGWQAGAIYRQIAEQERLHEPRSTPDKAYDRARQKLSKLLTFDDEQPSSLARQIPGVEALISEVAQQSPYYLLHEYANQGWRPLYVNVAHDMLASKQIYFIGSGNPTELLPDLIPVKIRKLLDAESDLTSRELLYDIATCRRFRRDIFTRGRCALTSHERARRLENLFLTNTRTNEEKIKPLQTDFGEVSAIEGVLNQIFEHLETRSCSLKSLSEALNQPLEHTAGLICMLLSQNNVGITSPTTQPFPTEIESINFKLAQLIREGNPYAHLVAPGIGSAVQITIEQAKALVSHLDQSSIGDVGEVQSMLPLLRRTACIS